MTKHFEIRVSGQVQDVGFRYNAQKLAHRLGINGTVQNLADNSVLIHAEGDDEILEQFLSWCQEGPEAAVVSKVTCRQSPVVGYEQFKILTK